MAAMQLNMATTERSICRRSLLPNDFINWAILFRLAFNFRFVNQAVYVAVPYDKNTDFILFFYSLRMGMSKFAGVIF